MKRLFIVVIICVLTKPLLAQQLLVLKSNDRLVVKVYKENGASVYYSEWPDTTKTNVKAILQDNIKSLMPIQPSDLDSIIAVVIAENNLKSTKEKQEQAKWFTRQIVYYRQKISYGRNNIMSQGGLSLEVGMEGKNRYRAGLGMGFDRINIGNSYGIQFPFFISVDCIFLNMGNKHQIYGLTNVGYNFVLNADDVLGNNKLFMYGMGLCLSDVLIIEVYYKMQQANTIYQQNGRADQVGISLGGIF